ncbi:hypothetical protein Ciccas_008526 [Cichlidogyrus casuarinus]|uniref:Uncharacterized protein n=1 Tax=Cichlidogyrus casuarinus TaxID=1844966 RepID=A0ABD2PZU0_9PLAT
MTERHLFTNPYNDEDLIYETPSPTRNENISLFDRISKLSRHVSNQALEKVSVYRQKLLPNMSTDFAENVLSVPQLIKNCCHVVNVDFDDKLHQITCAKVDSNSLLYLSIAHLPFIFCLEVEPDLNPSALKVEHEAHGALIPLSFLVDTDNGNLFVIAKSYSKPGRILIKFVMTQNYLKKPLSSLFYDYDRYVAMALNLDGSLLLIFRNSDEQHQICHLSSDFSRKEFIFSIGHGIPQEGMSNIPLELAKLESKNHFWILYRTQSSNELMHIINHCSPEQKVDHLSCGNFQPIALCPYDKDRLLMLSQDRNVVYSIDQTKVIKTVFCSSQQEQILTLCSHFEATTLPDSELIAKHFGTLSYCYVITTARLIKLIL